MLECDQGGASFLRTRHTRAENSSRVPEGDRLVGTRVGAYTLNRVIAAGGMGTVYEATQEQPRRTVAVKLMHPGISSPSAEKRFKFESQLLAQLHHDGIAQVYEAGTHCDGDVTVPFFAMEYIVGASPITTYVKRKNLDIREKMRLFALVCEAVHHGHQKGIIHRDLKPGNILVSAAGQVKIIDFGVARATDSDLALTTLHTDVGQLIGTLQYMSPEQCEADPQNIDTRSDIYALGVVFYELLCDRLPYNVTHKAMHEATRVIREEQPAKLSTLSKALRGDIETIALKALEKERDRRYQSATDFSQDIHRYLRSEPISAHPPSFVYQFRVFARRNRSFVGAVATVFMALLGGLVASSVMYVRAERARAETAEAWEAESRQAETAEHINTFLQDMLGAAQPERALGHEVTVREVLDRASQQIDEFAGSPAVESGIRSTIGKTYYKLGLFDEAEAHLERALDLAVRSAPDHLGACLATLGNLRRAQGRLDEARDLYRRSLDALRASLGTNDARVGDMLQNLGTLALETGRLAEAGPLLLEAVGILEASLGTDEVRTVEAQSALGAMYFHRGMLDKAESVYRDCLAAQRRLLGTEKVATIASMNNLGVILKRQGKLEEAQTLLVEAAAVSGRLYGPAHPYTIQARKSLAQTLEARGDVSTAKRMYLETLETAREALGAKHPTTLSLLNTLAALYTNEGNYEPAERLDGEVLAGHSAVGGENHPMAAAVETSREALGAEHPTTLGLLVNLAFLRREEGNYNSAERLYREGLAGHSALYGTEHFLTAEVMIGLGVTLCTGRDTHEAYLEAEQLLANALRIMESRRSPGHPWLIRIMEQLVDLYGPEKLDDPHKRAEYEARLPARPTSARKD